MSQIQENIKNTALELIHKKLLDTMLNLVYDMSDLHLSLPEDPLPQFVTEAIDRLRGYTLELPQILEKDLSQRGEYINTLTALRNEYADKVMPFYSYVSATNHIGSYALWLYKCATTDGVNLGNYVPIEHSVRDFVREYIADAEPEDKPFRMSSIIALIPLRMTRQRYVDLTRKSFELSLANNTKAQLKETVRVAKSVLYPINSPDYGDFMPSYKEEIDELYLKNMEKCSSQELEDVMLQIDNLQASLERCGDYLNMVYNDINYLIILASYAIDEEYLVEENMLVKDSLYSAMDMLKTKDFDLYAEALAEKSAELIEDNFTSMREQDRTLMEYTTQYYGTDVINEELETLLGTYVNINLIYMYELTYAMQTAKTTEESVPSTPEDRKAAAEELINFLEGTPASISKTRDKFSRSEFLGSLPVAMTDSEFEEYLDYALDAVRMKNAGIVAMTDIYNMLAEEGIIPDFEAEDEEHCDCGHDHHHDHDHCECGHDHPHPHIRIVKDDE